MDWGLLLGLGLGILIVLVFACIATWLTRRL